MPATDVRFAAGRGGERIVARCRELAQITDVDGETTRTFLSPAMRRANALVAEWMRAARLTVRMDAAGNLRGVRGDGPRLLLASHLDTVVNAGAFDGPLGVVLAIEAAAGEPAGVLEVIAFSEEEGVRFRTPFLGSRALAGMLDEAALALEDAAGVTVRQALVDYGLDPEELPQARLGAEAAAYLEVHIEQGPVLEAVGRPLGVVHALAGQSRLRVTFSGQANHAGTTPMALRHDALAAAAEWIVSTEALACRHAGLVATVGALAARPGLGNVVAGSVVASLDVRHALNSERHVALRALLEAASAAAARRGVRVGHELLLDQSAVALDPRLTALLQGSAAACGYDAQAMVSGAGHDAMILAPHLPAAMLFVRTPGGISHHPEENVALEDVQAALASTMEFMRRFAAAPICKEDDAPARADQKLA